MLLLECLVAYYCWGPIVVEVLTVKVVIVVACCRNDVCPTIRDADYIVTESHHVFRIGIAVIPLIHEYVVNLYRSVALSVCERTPNASLLAVLLGCADAEVGEVTELLNYCCVAVRVLVGTYVETWAAENGLLAAEVLHEE